MMRLMLTLSVLLGLFLIGPRAARAQTGALPPDQSLESVSCPTTIWCMAVGSRSAIQYGVGDVNTVGLAERWNGSAWSEVPLPQPATAISCTSPAACTAVGNMTAERWDGTSWTVQAVPIPPDSFGPGLSSVSCASATYCVAVGGYTLPSTSGAPPPWQTLIEAWNGNGWSRQASPVPADHWQAVLTSVSCGAPDSCIALGKYPSSTTVVAVYERWDGEAWTEEPLPGLAAYPGTLLTSISCTSATACTAIGSDQDSPSHASPVAARWNGSDWSVSQMPLPTGIYTSQLDTVSCSAATSCVAVGFYVSSTGPVLSLVERWNGSSWTVQPLPVPAGSSGRLSSVSCASADMCLGVGWFWSNSWGRLAFMEAWNGAGWAIQRPPNSPTSSSLEAVSCPSAATCIAVGNQQDQSGISATLAEQWNGRGAWTTRPTPDPAGTLSSSLEAISCSSSRACTAVGSYLSSGGTWLPLAERWDGSTWAIQATSDPGSGAISALSGVACPSARVCLAVGSQQAGDASVPLAERWNGTGWSIQSFPVPPGVVSASLSAISCSSSSACTAVGSLRYGGGSSVPEALRDQYLPLVARWNGSAWARQQTPAIVVFRPPSSFSSVSCPGAASCFAVGSGSNSQYTNISIAERWNGKRWSMQSYPNPANVTAGTPESISCSSPSACTAVSFASSTGTGFVPVIGRWNGKKWTMQSPGSPWGALQTQLIGVSCPARSACVAVGHSIDASGNQLPLIEHWTGAAWSAPPPRAEEVLSIQPCLARAAPRLRWYNPGLCSGRSGAPPGRRPRSLHPMCFTHRHVPPP